MKEIELTKGKVASVDDEDFDSLSIHKWYYHSEGYAARREKGTNKMIFMHRQILGTPKGFDTDHINCDGLDNRKCNLRLASRAQNLFNVKIGRGNKSGYKGVSWHKAAKKWEACIKANGKKLYLGCFATTELAAAAYNKAAVKHFGQYARLNNIGQEKI